MIDLKQYQSFVTAVTSDPSSNIDSFNDRVAELSTQINVPLLLTSAIGMAAEIGEFCEIPKKMLFQGKPLTDDTLFHMKRELGDVMWYWMNACTALNLNPDDVIQENVRKLESRYPGGTFNVYASEHRVATDI